MFVGAVLALLTSFLNAACDGSDISGCLFSHLHDASGSGGAFSITAGRTANIRQSTFLNCSASGIGGACLVVSDRITINQTCFLECWSTKTGQAMYVSMSTTDSGPFINIGRVSFLSCGNHGIVTTAKEGTLALGRAGNELGQSYAIISINITPCSVDEEGAALLHTKKEMSGSGTDDASGAVSWRYGFVMKCGGRSCWWHSRSGTVKLTDVGFYHNDVSYGVISLPGGSTLDVTGCHFVETSTIPYAPTTTITFTGCYFSGPLPTTQAQFITGNVAQATLPTYTYPGCDAHLCTVTPAMATKSGSPIATPTRYFTKGFTRQTMRILVFGFYFMPMELVW
jgi:hypothetical protein